MKEYGWSTFLTYCCNCSIRFLHDEKCAMMLDAHHSRVYMLLCVGEGSHKRFSPLRKGLTDKPLLDRIICLLDQIVPILDQIMSMFDQFISKETNQHWFIWRKTSQKCKVVPDYVHFFTNSIWGQTSNA